MWQKLSFDLTMNLDLCEKMGSVFLNVVILPYISITIKYSCVGQKYPKLCIQKCKYLHISDETS